MTKFLPADQVHLLVDHLSRFGEVHGPVITDQKVLAFGPVGTFDDLILNYQRTLLPPKKYLLPSRQTIFSWDSALGYRPLVEREHPVVLFGLHPCDLTGIGYLDRVFLSDPPDLHYQAHRSRLVLVGISCDPDSYCFCGSFGQAEPGFDLFVQQVESNYVISAGSEKGVKILEQSPFPHRTASGPAGYPPAREEFEIMEAVSRGETFSGSPLWEEFGIRCLSCGACSLCCPTCYCFDVRENADLEGDGATRLRDWDNCLFRTHGEIAGGHNFRPSRIDRFRYRYQHKYLGFGPTRGIVSCVGCGRCREVCPVSIDLLDLFEKQP